MIYWAHVLAFCCFTLCVAYLELIDKAGSLWGLVVMWVVLADFAPKKVNKMKITDN